MFPSAKIEESTETLIELIYSVFFENETIEK
jgi:hypothetical protein